MLTATAQAVAHIQYRPPISAPQAADQRRIEALELPYVVWLSDFKPEAQIQSPTFVSPRWAATPISIAPEYLLDWDVVSTTTPIRPSGEMIVKLEYAGRGTPIHIQPPWE